MICEVCGAAAVVELNGRVRRMAWLKESFKTASEERQKLLAERIMDHVEMADQYRCADHAVCGTCRASNVSMLGCELCGAPACVNCSLPALQTDKAGRIIPESADGRIICARCNPPTGGSNAGLYRPSPTAPLLV